jgi:O-acetylhomoserine/O-acetylserine sulfhydrylase-like pyridoxal-dependent enzyme
MIISDKSAFLTKLSAYDSTITSTSKINNISSIPYVNDTNATPIYNPTQYTFEDSTQIIHPDDLQQTTFITGDISTDKKQSDIFQ